MTYTEWKEGIPCECCGTILQKCKSCGQLWPIPPRHEVCTDCFIDGKGE